MVDKTWVLVLLSLFLPPVPVVLRENEPNIHLLVNILLCLLGWLPGVIHALWIVLRSKD